jgi:hypothetical protein
MRGAGSVSLRHLCATSPIEANGPNQALNMMQMSTTGARIDTFRLLQMRYTSSASALVGAY